MKDSPLSLEGLIEKLRGHANDAEGTAKIQLSWARRGEQDPDVVAAYYERANDLRAAADALARLQLSLPTVNREAIARIIDPDAFRIVTFDRRQNRSVAYRKADAILALSPSPQAGGSPVAPDSGLIRRSEVIDLLGRLANEHADMALEGTDRSRACESMEAALTRAKYAVAFLPAIAPPQAGGDELREALERIKTIAAAATHDGWNSTRLADIKVHANRALAALTKPDASNGGA